MEKNSKTPHALCGAKTRSGIPCQNWGMANGRCRMHGGKSTGPRTAEGRERIRQANWKHGKRSAQAREEHREVRKLLRSAKELSRAIEQGIRKGSLTPDELNLMLEQESHIQYKLFSIPEEFKYLSFRDCLALANYIEDQIKGFWSFFDKLKEHQEMGQKADTDPGGSSATEKIGESEYPKTITIGFCSASQKLIIEENDNG